MLFPRFAEQGRVDPAVVDTIAAEFLISAFVINFDRYHVLAQMIACQAHIVFL